MTFTKQLRDAAMQCSNVDYRALLRWAADEVDITTRAFSTNPTEFSMRALNGAWAAAQRTLKNIPPEAPPAPLAGSPEPARLAA